jgi:hypothetical protein
MTDDRPSRSTIVSGRFTSITSARATIAALRERGFADDEIASFYVTPPGQHGSLPAGGDAHADKGAAPAAEGAKAGALAGAAGGLALGAVAAVAAPIAAVAVAAATTGVGAYVGSLYGALNRMEDGKAGEGGATHEAPVERPGGSVIAVRADGEGREDSAVGAFVAHGALDISRGVGEWGDGGWSDFDPRTPHPRVSPAELAAAHPDSTPPSDAGSPR